MTTPTQRLQTEHEIRGSLERVGSRGERVSAGLLVGIKHLAFPATDRMRRA